MADAPSFGIRTMIRVSPLGFVQGEAVSTNCRSNSVSLHGAQTDDWVFDGCFDALPSSSVSSEKPCWSTNEQIFNSFWKWLIEQQIEHRDLACLITGGPGSGKSFTLFGAGDITDRTNIDAGVLPRFMHEAYAVCPESEIEINASLVHGEDIIDLLNPPCRSRARESLCHSDSLGVMIINCKTLTARSIGDSLMIICLAWRAAAVFSVEGLPVSSPCHLIVTVKTLNRKTAVYSTIQFIELAWMPSMYTLKQSLPAAVDRFTGRSKHNKSALLLAELAKQSIANSQPNPRKKKKNNVPLTTEGSALTYLLQDNIYQNPCCYVIACVRPISEHRIANCMFFDFIIKLGHLMPIKSPNPEAYERSILRKVPSFSSTYKTVGINGARNQENLKHEPSPPMPYLEESFAPLYEKIDQEIKNVLTLSSHVHELLVFESEVDFDVYDGIIVKKEDISVREEKKKKKAMASIVSSSDDTRKKKGYKQRELELKERQDKEMLSALIAAEDMRKKDKVALLKDVAALFYRKVVHSDYFLFWKKRLFLADFIGSLKSRPEEGSIVDDASEMFSWLGRRTPLRLSLFRTATEYLMQKSWIPPSSFIRPDSSAESARVRELVSDLCGDSEVEVPLVAEECLGDGVYFPPPRFQPFVAGDLIEYTTSVVEPHLRYFAPNNAFCFDKLTFPIQLGHTIVTGISVESLDWCCENSQQRHDSEVVMREVAHAAVVAANDALKPVALPSETENFNEGGEISAIGRCDSKFSMLSDADNQCHDPIQRIVFKEERRNAESKKKNYADGVEMFVAGMKTLGLIDIGFLGNSANGSTQDPKDLHIMTCPCPGIEPLHCVFSRFGEKLKLQVYAGVAMDQAVAVDRDGVDRPDTAVSQRSRSAQSAASDQAAQLQAAQLPLVWVNGVPVTTVTIYENGSNVAGVCVKGKKKAVPVSVILKNNDIIRLGVASYFQVVIPEEVLPDQIIAGQDQSFKLEDIQAASRGTTPSNKAPSRTITASSSGQMDQDAVISSLTEWELALTSSYNQEILLPLIIESETQRQHFLHLSVNRELAQIVKTADRTVLMSMMSFSPSREEAMEIIANMQPSLKAQLCEMLCAVHYANYLSQTMSRGVYFSMHIAYVPTSGDLDFPDTGATLFSEVPGDNIHKKSNSVEITPSVSPGVPLGLDQRADGCMNVTFGGRLYECRVLAEIVTGSSEDDELYRVGPSGNRATRCHWWWSISLFLERYSLMQELYCLFLSECGADVSVLDEALFSSGPINDPFIDPPQDELVGVAFLHLDSLQYLLDVTDVLPIFNFNGQRAGSAKVHMRCWIDEIETIPEYISVDKETHITNFLDHKMIVRLYFENLLDIPDSMSSGLYVAFNFFFHGGTYSTSRHCGITTNPFLNDAVVIEQTITNDFIEYLKTGSLELEVYGKRIVPNGALEDQRRSREAVARPADFNPGTGGPSFRLRNFGVSTGSSPYVTAATMAQFCGEPFDWKRGGASNLEGSAGQSTLKTLHALEEELKHMEEALEESERKLRHANKLAATMKNDRESIRGELSKLQSDVGPGFSATLERLEAAEIELRKSRKEIERLSKKSRVCVLS